MHNLPQVSQLPSLAEIIAVIEEASLKSLSYWNSSFTISENKKRFEEYKALA